tara:strand:- start:994 stop:2322 length:1329 start_codon:yes stop_codon:yes gene_type:complete
VNKNLAIIFLFFFVSQCSFGIGGGFWSSSNIKEEENKINKKELFATLKISDFEINKDLEINIESIEFFKNSFKNNLINNNGRLNYDGNLKKALKYKFSKIENFEELEPEIIFEKKNIIFFANKGSILKFDDQSKLIWEKNYYSKTEKKNKPTLQFSNNKDILIIADSISKYYALNINSGELLWSKNNSTAFNSEIKIFKDKIFVIDYDNILRCFSIKNGKEIWKVKTENKTLKSQKKLSLVILKNKIIFNNSSGDITAVNSKTGKLLWVVPTVKTRDSTNAYFLKMSNIIANENSIFVSNNFNEFYSIDVNSGLINWTQNINSTLKATLLDKIIFSVTDEGYFVIINSSNGEIIRRTYLFDGIKKNLFDKIKKKKITIKPTGFIVGKNKIYISTNNGRILVGDIKSGKVISSIKIDNDLISRPFVLNKNLFVIKANGIVKIN